MLKRSLGVAAGAAALALALSGCVVEATPSTSPGGTGGGAKAEKLTVACGAMEEVCDAWTKAYSAKSGIPTSFVRLSSGETVARLAATKDAPEFDVWHGGPADGYGAAAGQGLIEAYVPENAAKIPEKYKDPEGYWHGVYVGALGFCSNSKVLAEKGVPVPTSWDELLDPRLKSQISTAHPSTSGTAFTTLWTQVVRLGSEDAGLGFMAKMHNNVLQYTKSGTAPGQVAGRGEVAVGLVFSHDCVVYKERGMTDLEVSFPSEGTGFEVGGVAVIANTKNQEAARQYANWALTPEAQELGPTVGSYQLPTNPATKSDPRMANLADITLVDYDFAKAAERKKELTARFDAEIAAQPKE